MSDMSGYRALFISEMRSSLEALEDALSSLKENPEDPESINEVFRITHTIKGMAATMGYNITADLAHKMEDLMSRIRDGQRKEGDLKLLMEGSDLLNELLESIIGSGRDISVDVKPLMEKYEARLVPRYPPSAAPLARLALENTPASSASLSDTDASAPSSPVESDTDVQPAEVNVRRYSLKIKISEKSLMKDARAVIVIERLRKCGDIKEVIPSADGMESENFDGNLSVILESRLSPEQLKKEVLAIREIDDVSIESGDETRSPAGASSLKKKQNSDFQSVRVSISHLDELQSLIEELVVQKGRLNTIASSLHSPNLSDIASNIESIVSRLTGVAMELRLVPAKYMFRRFQRIVRSIAREQGKEVEFVVEGDNIEMDRPVLEIVGEAIIHLIKNSIDHGIEPPEVRKQQGKDPVGHISLRAVRERGYSVFVVEDDGRGIDADAVAEVAVKKGLISREEADSMSKEEKINLIFRPGFSTAEQVTSVSGRGVGMDVVMHILERIGGTLEIETGPNAGTRITLKLPFTTAIIEALVVRIGRNRYVVPLQAIVSILSVHDVRRSGLLTTVAGRHVVVYKGSFYPVIDAVEYLSPDLHDRELLPENGFLLLLRHGRSLFSLPVDNILSKDDMVVKPVESLSDSFRTFSTATVMVDGSVAFVMDLSLLMKWGGISA